MTARGMTLVEILIALLVLAIGLPSVIIMVMGCTRTTSATSYRNVTALILAEAQDEIERLHCITNPVTTPDHSADKGYYIETWNSTITDLTTYPHAPTPPSSSAGETAWPNTLVGYYSTAIPVSGGLGPTTAYQNPNFPGCLFWPLGPDSKFYAGPQKRAINDDTVVGAGLAFRVVYKLERHPDWTRSAYSPYAGVYVLTMTAYHDLSPRIVPSSTSKKMEQVSDPVVVYLRRKN